MADERIVSESVVGSSNPIARYGRGIMDSIKGIGGGFISILIGFFLLYNSVGMKENSGMVAKLPVTPSENVSMTQVGLVKMTGKPQTVTSLISPKTSESVIYYKYTTEEFRKVEQMKTEYRTVQKDGQDVQQTVETPYWTDVWVPTNTDEKSVDFKLGQITVQPQSASKNYNLKSIYDQEIALPAAANPTQIVPVTYGGKNVNSYPATKTRERVVGVPADQTILVIGEVNNGYLRSGDPFIVSNKTDAEVVADLKSAENLKFWLMKGGAWFFIATGLTALFGPIFAILNILPGLGSALNGLVFFVNAILAAIIVALGSLVIKFWYIFLAVIVIGVIALLVLRSKKSA